MSTTRFDRPPLARPLRILMVDDVAEDAELNLRELTRAGLEVSSDVVARREEFSVRLSAHDYDLVLADFHLPDWNGYEVLEILRQQRRHIPLILVTGSIGEEVVAECIRRGAADYVLKDHLVRLPIAVRRVLAEKTQREERTRLAEERDRFFMLSPDLLCIVNAQGEFQQLNPAWQRGLGFTLDELVVAPLEQLVHPEDRAPTRERLQSLVAGAGSVAFENRLRTKDGADRWFAWRATAIPGQPRIYATARDITERKRAEASLRESEARKAAIMASALDAIITMDHQGHVLEFNPAAEIIFGYSQTETIGRKIGDLILPVPPREGEFQPFGDSLATGQGPDLGRRVEITARRRNGEEFPCEVAVTRIGSHSPPTFTSYLHDITKRRRQDEQLREQAALLDKAQEAIWVQDLAGNIVYWNKSAERLYGWTAGDVLGRNPEPLLQATDATLPENPNAITLARGEWNGELRHTSRPGRQLVIDSRRTLVRDSQGKPKSILVINTDITAKKSLEAQAFRNQRIQSLGTLAGGIAHDLNNVLTPFLMSVDLLREMVGNNPRAHSVLDNLLTSAQHGVGMVRQITTFAKSLPGDKAVLHAGQIVDEMVCIARDTFPRTIEIITHVPADLWSVEGDSAQLHQVLLNLCVNARDAMPQGGQLRIDADNVSLDEHYARLHLDARPGPYVVLTVTDTGTGIPQEIIDKIFEPFFSTKEGTGTGLGLANVLGVVKGHGGFLNVYSEVGKGSRFRIYLPATEAAAATPAAKPAAPFPAGRGEQVLLVDDEQSFRDITKSILEKYNYRVLTATQGREAIDLYSDKRSEIDVVITDLSMPVMDGIATMRALQHLDPAVRLIATSGMANGGQLPAATNGEQIKFLLKPYPAEKLLNTLQDVMGTAVPARPPEQAP